MSISSGRTVCEGLTQNIHNGTYQTVQLCGLLMCFLANIASLLHTVIRCIRLWIVHNTVIVGFGLFMMSPIHK